MTEDYDLYSCPNGCPHFYSSDWLALRLGIMPRGYCPVCKIYYMKNEADKGEEMTAENFQKQTLTITEAAEILGIGRQSAYDLARRGELPGIRKLGKRFIISRIVLEEYLKGHENEDRLAAKTRLDLAVGQHQLFKGLEEGLMELDSKLDEVLVELQDIKRSLNRNANNSATPAWHPGNED